MLADEEDAGENDDPITTHEDGESVLAGFLFVTNPIVRLEPEVTENVTQRRMSAQIESSLLPVLFSVKVHTARRAFVLVLVRPINAKRTLFS